MSRDYSTAERLALFRYRNRTEPHRFLEESYGIKLWKEQAHVLSLLRRHQFVSVRSGNGVGKSYVAAACIPWYVNSFAPSYVITTSSSWRSVKYIMWPKLHTIINNSPIPEFRNQGRLLDMEWKLGDEWGAFPLSPTDPENFAGFRPSGGVLILVDEASALSTVMYDAMMGLCSHSNSKILMIGNPLRPSGAFFETFRSSIWATHHISALDCPNVKEGREVIPGLSTLAWAEARAEEWGVDSPIYQARVLGEFPSEDEHTLIQLWEAEAAGSRYNDMVDEAETMALAHVAGLAEGEASDPKFAGMFRNANLPTERYLDIVEPGGKIRLGVDVARFGDDKTVIFPVRGQTAYKPIVRSKQDTMTTAGMVAQLIDELNPEVVNVDVDGLGGGVVDRLHELGYRNIVIGIHSAGKPLSKPTDPASKGEYLNIRAEGWFNLKEWFRLGGRIPDDKSIIASVTSPKYEIHSSGRLKIEDKDKTKKTLGHSPDLADALWLAVLPTKPKGEIAW